MVTTIPARILVNGENCILRPILFTASFQDLERRLEVDVRGNSAWFDQAAWAEALHLREQVRNNMRSMIIYLSLIHI